MSVPSLGKEDLFGLLKIRKPTEKEIEKARAKQQAKQERAAQKEEKERQQAAQKTALRTSKDKPVYEDKAKPEIDAAIAELEALAGTGVAVAELMQLRSDAAARADAGAYSEAVALLKPVSSLLSKAKEAAAKVGKSAKKWHPDQFAAAEGLLKDLNQRGPELSERHREKFKAEINDAVSVLYDPNAGTSDAAVVLARIDALKRNLDLNLRLAKKVKQDVDGDLVKADGLLLALKDLATTAELARLTTLVDGARTLQGEREHVDAKAALDEVFAKGTLIRDAALSAKAEWATRAAQLAERVAAARALAADRKAPTLHEITPTAQEVLDALIELVEDAKTLPGLIGFGPATQTYDLLAAQLADVQARAKADAALGPLRQKANEQVQGALEEVDEQLGRLHQRVSAFFPDRDPSDLDGPFLDEKAAAEAEWTEGMRRVGSDKALLSLAASVMKKLTATCARIDGVIDNTVSFTDALSSRNVEIAREAFESARRHCALEIDALLALDAASGIEQSNLLDALVKQEIAAKSDLAIDGLTKRVGTLAQRTKMKIQLHVKRSDALKARVAEQMKSAEEKLEEFTALIAKKSARDLIRKPTKERDYGELRELFKGQIADQLVVARMSETGILDACEGDLIALNFSLSAAIAAIKGGKDAKALNVGSMSSMNEEIEKLRQRLNGHDFTKYLAERQFELTGTLDTLAGELRSMPLEKARLRINECEKEVAAAEVAAVKARAAYKALEARASEVGKKLKDKAFAQAPDFKAVLQGKLDKCLADALAGDATNMNGELAKIDAEIDQATSDPSVRKAGQDSAAADARKAEQEAAEWKSRYEIVVAAISKNTTALTKDRAELTQLAKSANEAYKKTKDMQAATMQLRAVNDRIDFLQRYPDGMEVTARHKLPKVRDRWKKSLEDLKGGLDLLVTEIGKLDPADVPQPAAAAVTASIGAVKNLFDPFLFDTAVDAMSSKKQSRKELSAMREQALRAVHRTQAIFESDQRLVDLARNPFKPGIDRLITNAKLALAEFETNLLISL